MNSIPPTSPSPDEISAITPRYRALGRMNEATAQAVEYYDRSMATNGFAGRVYGQDIQSSTANICRTLEFEDTSTTPFSNAFNNSIGFWVSMPGSNNAPPSSNGREFLINPPLSCHMVRTDVIRCGGAGVFPEPDRLKEQPFYFR